MKANTIMALKKVVKEMVSREVAKQIKIVVAEITNPTISEVDAVDHNTTPKSQKQQLAKDPVLNKILNETMGGIPTDTEYPTMGGGAYTSDKIGEITGGVATQSTVDIPDFMKKAMSGQSAKVIKAIEDKHGTKS